MLKTSHGNNHKIKESEKRKVSYEGLSSKVYDSFILGQKILVLVLQCYCRDNVKYGLFQKTSFMESTDTPVEKIST